MIGWLQTVDGAADIGLFLAGAGLLVGLTRLWVPRLRARSAAGYVLIVFVLFAPALLTSRNQVPLDYVYRFSPWADTLERPARPQNPVLTDVVLQMLPFRHLVRERLLEGSVPLWSHELGTGQPLLANAQSAPFAPLHLMALPLPTVRAMTVSAAWQVLVALLATHLLLLELGAGRWGAVLAALAFALSTFSFSWLYYPLGMAGSWTPAVLLGVLRLLRGAPRAWVGLGLVAAALALSGHPTVIVHTAVVAAVVLAIGLRRGASPSRQAVLRGSLLAAMLAAACAAPALVPVLEALPHGSRAVQVRRLAEASESDSATARSHDAQHRASRRAARDCRPQMLLQPFACGSPRDGNWAGPASYSGAAAYAGWIVLAVGVAGGLLLSGVPRFALLLGAACLAVALNPQWVTPEAVAGSPLAGMLHGRARVFWTLGLAVAAGLSLERLCSRRVGRWVLAGFLLSGAVLAHALAPADETAWQAAWRWVVVACLVAVTVTLAVPRWRRALPVLVLPLLAADLTLAGARYNPLVPAELDLAPPEVVRFLRAQETPFRVHAVGARFLPYLPAVYGLWDARGFDPMRPGEAERILRLRIAGSEFGGQFLQGPTIDTPFLSFLGIRYLLAGRAPPPAPWRLAYEGVGGAVWENPQALGIFFVPREAEPVGNRERALDYAATTERFAERALVEGITVARRRQRGKVRLLEAEGNRLRLALNGPPGTVYASSVTWMPGWRSDGETVRPVRVDGAYLGLVKKVPGTVVAELRYRPAGWSAGLAISAALAVLLALVPWLRRRRHADRSTEAPLASRIMNRGPAEQVTRARASARRLAALPVAAAVGLLSGCSQPPAGAPPSILLITIDTLRADHTTPYGYERRTTPHIRHRLADRGALFEHAYAPAPWTLPSMSALFAGRYPNELVGESLTGFGIPSEIMPLAERLAAAGYLTAAFNANPTMHEGNGFARGFTTYYTPDADAGWSRRNAADVGRRAIAWLREHQRQRFFLWVHFLDPHDPYLAPQLVDGRSDFYPEYAGPVRGHWPDGLYSGKIRRELAPDDVRQLVALYDAEVRHADSWIGKLLRAMDPEVARETFIVLTSDHGEELYEHGGFKHGQTLYEEQIHVPLIVRWDGRVDPGLRLPGEMTLIDLFPTLLDLARARPDPATDGVTILPVLRGEKRLPARSLVIQNLSPGPRRFAVIARRQKLFVFDRYAQFPSNSPLYTWLWRQDVERLERTMLFDLRRDPAETRNRAEHDAATVRAAGRLGHRQVLRQLHGLRLMIGNVPADVRVGGRLRFERPPAAIERYFLTPQDTVELTGSDLHFELTGGSLDKGLLIRGDVGELRDASAAIESAPPTPLRILVGAGEDYSGGSLPRATLEAGRWPATPDGPWLRIWYPGQQPPPMSPAEADPETRRRLRALGYVD